MKMDAPPISRDGKETIRNHFANLEKLFYFVCPENQEMKTTLLGIQEYG